MKKYLIIIPFLTLCLSGCAYFVAALNTLIITDISPDSDLINNQSYDFTVEVKCVLRSADVGNLYIVTNTNYSDSYIQVGDEIEVEKGGLDKYFTFNIQTTAKSWPDEDFYIGAHLKNLDDNLIVDYDYYAFTVE